MDIIRFTAEFVQRTLESAEGGHDWWHIHRVHTNAKKIALTEAVDSTVVELAALGFVHCQCPCGLHMV